MLVIILLNICIYIYNPEFGRVLEARIGLISHLRTYEANHHQRSYGHHQKRWTSLDELQK